MNNNEKNNFQKCDLHTHSTFSDGTLTPAELVREAKRLNIVIALCDHNTVSGLPQFMSESENIGVEAVPGIEFSTEYNAKELHIVGLFIAEKNYSVVRDFVSESVKLKELSNIHLVENLKKAGFTVEYDKIKAATPNGQVNRAHIAAELLRKGYVDSINTAFKTVLSKKSGLYIPPKELKTTRVIEFIREIGAVPVFAHPLISLSCKELVNILPELKKSGLLAMETMYSLYSNETTAVAKQIASSFNLCESGGSDFHGATKPDIFLGKGKGNVDVPVEVYYKLKELSEKIR